MKFKFRAEEKSYPKSATPSLEDYSGPLPDVIISVYFDSLPVYDQNKNTPPQKKIPSPAKAKLSILTK